MNFKAYDILSSLIPGFLFLLALQQSLSYAYDKDMVVAYTAIAFLMGYLMNTLSSWMEDVYHLTWCGKPSVNILNGKDVWKVRFYQSQKAKQLLLNESGNPNACNNELFSIAMRHGNGKSSRVDDFNASYAFSRVILTTVLFSGILMSIKMYQDWRFYAVFVPLAIILWLRCKQRSYYYCREVLNEYLKAK